MADGPLLEVTMLEPHIELELNPVELPNLHRQREVRA